MKIASPCVGFLLALLAALAPRCAVVVVEATTPPACRDCTTIVAFKLYTSGIPTKWPVYVPPNTIDTPGYFQRITEGRCIKTERVDDLNWNVMMFTESTYKNVKCCGDTDPVKNDYIDLCGKQTLSKLNEDTLEWEVVYASLTELYWPWFLFGDDPCSPSSSYSENSKVYSCNPSEKIYNSRGINNDAGGIVLGEGQYMLEGSTFHGCPPRSSSQRQDPAGPVIDTKSVRFYIKDTCP